MSFCWKRLTAILQRHATFFLVLTGVFWTGTAQTQTAVNGAVVGMVLDPQGLALPGVCLSLTDSGGREIRAALSRDNGWYGFELIPPGAYVVRAGRYGFTPVAIRNVRVHVTETVRIDVQMHLATVFETTQVVATAHGMRDTSALGTIVDRNFIANLPLVTRNFTHLAGLSPGVIVGVYNAGELGSGGTSLTQVGKTNDGIFDHGARSYENNWQLDGVSVSDILGSGAASGGVPLPNPDALEEFKVQTGIYDASFGRTAGANVSVVTKRGTNVFHGSAFEFVRNAILNANDFFLNRAGQRRPALNENQFGFAVGGPIKKDKILFFTSYQGRRQLNGVAAGQTRTACTATLIEPPMTNDRSPGALGRIFGGMQGALGGVAIRPDGSNINPVALKLLNLKLPDGSYLIPSPEVIDSVRPFASEGFSSFARPCTFTEDQGVGNFDYLPSQKSRVAAHIFVARTSQRVTFPGNGPNPVTNIAGFDSPGDSDFVVLSSSYVYARSLAALNQARIGFVRTRTRSKAKAPFSWSDIGVAAGQMNQNDELPTLSILGSVTMGTAFPRTYTQNTLSFSDIYTILRGAHSLKFGGSVGHLQEEYEIPGLASAVQFLSWPDFLLGLDANNNGTGSFSNVFASSDYFGLFNRDCAAWEAAGFLQEDYRVKRTLTLDMGVRYERIGHFADMLGRNSSFDFSRASRNPGPAGSLDGYAVGSNFPGPLPPGVIQTDNEFGIYGKGQNTIAPRLGFAWQLLPNRNWLVLKGGYGLYYSRPTGQASTQSILSSPFSLTRMNTGMANASATFQAPFASPFPTPDSFPLFVPYSFSTRSMVNTLASDFVPAVAEQSSISLQMEFRGGLFLQLGYVGARGMHLQRKRSLNQALNASPDDPIRGLTSNTLSNLAMRVPVPGISADGLRVLESAGRSSYHGLEISVSNRVMHGVQLVASYTFAKTLDTDGADINGTSAGSTLTLGDQNDPRQRWGRASFDRRQRLVISATWLIAGPATGMRATVFGGWSFASIATVQSGTALTISATNSKNVFGINEDRAQLSGLCSPGQIVNPGALESKLDRYFNLSCFASAPVVGADSLGTGFGNSTTGIVDGPAQANLDLAVTKSIRLKGMLENCLLELRAEYFNALNHPQFANPDTNFSSPTFGVISSTAVNPRVGQLAVKFHF